MRLKIKKKTFYEFLSILSILLVLVGLVLWLTLDVFAQKYDLAELKSYSASESILGDTKQHYPFSENPYCRYCGFDFDNPKYFTKNIKSISGDSLSAGSNFVGFLDFGSQNNTAINGLNITIIKKTNIDGFEKYKNDDSFYISKNGIKIVINLQNPNPINNFEYLYLGYLKEFPNICYFIISKISSSTSSSFDIYQQNTYLDTADKGNTIFVKSAPDNSNFFGGEFNIFISVPR